MENVFPLREGIDYSNLRMTPEGLYSVTRRRDAENILSFLRSRISDISKRSITDATACVGGDTIHFSGYFRKVDSIEWKHDNFVVLRNNVEVYGLKNVILHEGDATKIFNWKTDVL
jgi:tRNA/tmRNA/rRNA uracil-C5-methylase (TrmA/RlmC/RlmD family)